MNAVDVAPPAAMRVEIQKRTDGSAVLRCTRADGSVTWQHQRGHQARFFPLHDLMHYAVESTLGATRGFYGLIAAGWDIPETTGKGSRGALPPQALYVEHLVGLIERGGIGRAPLNAGEVNDELARLRHEGTLAYAPDVTDRQLALVHATAETLHERWGLVEPDRSLELIFPPR